MTAALDCRGLVVAPGGSAILRGVDLEIQPGSLTALAGPSGAGKTTLLRVIAGLEGLREGEVRLAGRDITRLPPHRRRIAVVFQEPRLLPHLTVVDNVALPLRAAGVGRSERRSRAGALLDQVGLGGMGARSISRLSGGEQQRVALARALVGDPQLLLLDEPLAAVDPNRRESLRRLISRVQAERSLTTLLVTHDRSEAAELGQSIALMLEGRIVQHASPRDLFERPRTAAIARFFGAVNILRDGQATYVIRPEAVQVGASGPIRAVVTAATFSGTYVRLALQAGDREYEAHVPAGTLVAVGEEVGVTFPDDALWRLPQGDDGELQSLRHRDQHHRGERPRHDLGA